MTRTTVSNIKYMCVNLCFYLTKSTPFITQNNVTRIVFLALRRAITLHAWAELLYHLLDQCTLTARCAVQARLPGTFQRPLIVYWPHSIIRLTSFLKVTYLFLRGTFYWRYYQYNPLKSNVWHMDVFTCIMIRYLECFKTWNTTTPIAETNVLVLLHLSDVLKEGHVSVRHIVWGLRFFTRYSVNNRQRSENFIEPSQIEWQSFWELKEEELVWKTKGFTLI
jgi:hypothetical protein